MNTNLASLRRKIESKGGVLTLEMGELRKMFGAQRLGANIRAAMSNTLKEAGIGHYPTLLPNNQHSLVRFYLLSTPLPEVVKAVNTPGPEGDRILVEALGLKPSKNDKKEKVAA